MGIMGIMSSYQAAARLSIHLKYGGDRCYWQK
jgi:hypothetical protein